MTQGPDDESVEGHTDETVLYEYQGARIVRSPDVLGGNPHIADTQIGVHHVAQPIVDADSSITETVEVRYPNLSRSQVIAALNYYADNPDQMAVIKCRSEED